MTSPLASVLRLASLVICLIVIASFALFVVHQTSDASSHQQQKVNEAAPGAQQSSPAPASGHPESAPRRKIDDVSRALTSPFSGVTSGSSSQWVIRGANLLLALVVYGFGLGFLARFIRIRL